MTGLKLALVAGLAVAMPGVAIAQEADDCTPQTIAQLLGIEEIAGCVDDGDGGTDMGDVVETTGPVSGLQTAHEASGGKSTAALEHANAMSGGAVLAALSGSNGDDDDEDDAGDDDDDGRGRPDHAGGGRP